MNRLFDLIKFAEIRFPSKNKNENRRDAEFIISEVLKIKPIDIYTSKNEISSNEMQTLENYFQRYAANEPVQHILGYAYFRDLKLKVNRNVLIPRPETELLVNKAIELSPLEKSIIIDVGTGSGAIAVSLALELKNSDITAIDISDKALETAEENSKCYGIKNIKFLKNNLCSGISENFADIITANLPYVTMEEYNNLEFKVKEFDPKLALYGGLDGLDLIGELVNQSTSVLKKQGWLLLEIGFQQGKATADILKKTGSFKSITIIKDFNNLDRIAAAQKIG